MPCPYKMRGANFTLCTPQVVCIGFRTAIPVFRLRITPISFADTAVYTRIFSAGRLVRPQEPVRCLPHFSNVGGLARQNPNNAYLIGRAVVCYFFRCDLPKFSGGFVPVTCSQTHFSPMRVLLLDAWRPLFVALLFGLGTPFYRTFARFMLQPFHIFRIRLCGGRGNNSFRIVGVLLEPP